MFTSTNAFSRTIAVFAFFIILSSAAFAACGPISCDNRPLVIPPAPQSVVLPPAPEAPLVSTAVCTTNVCNASPVCSTCTDPRVQPTTLPGVYSRDYDYAVTSQRNTSGLPFLIPTVNGLLESPTIPLTNNVDQFYATHHVVNGQVVRTAPNPPNRAVSADFSRYYGSNPAFGQHNAYAGYNATQNYRGGLGL